MSRYKSMNKDLYSLIDQCCSKLDQSELNNLKEMIQSLVKETPYESFIDYLQTPTDMTMIEMNAPNEVFQKIENEIISISSVLIYIVKELATTSENEFKDFAANSMDKLNVYLSSIEETLIIAPQPKLNIDSRTTEGFSFSNHKFFLFLVLFKWYLARIFFNARIDDYLTEVTVQNEKNLISYIIKINPSYQCDSIYYILESNRNLPAAKQFKEVSKAIRFFILDELMPLITKIMYKFNSLVAERNFIIRYFV